MKRAKEKRIGRQAGILADIYSIHLTVNARCETTGPRFDKYLLDSTNPQTHTAEITRNEKLQLQLDRSPPERPVGRPGSARLDGLVKHMMFDLLINLQLVPSLALPAFSIRGPNIQWQRKSICSLPS